MELSEVLSRIFGRHRILVIAFVLLGIGAGLALHWSDDPKYQGTARLLVTSSDPSTTSEAAALADSVRALATGPALVRKALASIGVERDAAQVAAHDVSVRSLGSSGVVELQVRDRVPGVALRLTKAIGRAVVNQRMAAASRTITDAIAGLRRQIIGVRDRISRVDKKLAAVTADTGSFDPSIANIAVAEREQLLAQRTTLTDQLTVLTSHMQDLTAQLALRPPAAMVDPPEAPATVIRPQRFPDAALGGLLGLVIGVAIAAGLETIRPTVVGRAAIARSLKTPVLGELRPSGPHWNPDDLLEVASHIGLAAAGAGVKRVDLISTSPNIDLARLASAFREDLTHLSVEVATPTAIVDRVVGGDDATGPGRAPHRGRPAPQRGLVLVLPEAVKLADLEPVRDFLAISGWPCLGLIIAQRVSPLFVVRRESTTHTTATSEATA